MASQIANPRRLLILSPTSQSISIIPPFLHSLTGVPVLDPPQQQTHSTADSTASTTPESTPASSPSAGPSTTTTFAGYTTHSPLRIETKYYTTEVPVWVDEIPLVYKSPDTDSKSPTAEQWQTEFLSPEAEIVRDAVGALVICVQNPRDTRIPPEEKEAHAHPAQRTDVRALRDLVRHVGAVKERIDEERGGVGDVPGVFVLVGCRRAGTMRADPAAVANSDDSGLDLGVERDDLGDGIEDAPFSVGWWEDQLFDMGLLGWEVVEWDPREQDPEETRNQFGGMLSVFS